MRILFTAFVLSIIIISCNNDSSVNLHEMPSVYPAPKTIKLDTANGYKTNPITGKKIEPIINSQGDTVLTGRPIKAKGRVLGEEEVLFWEVEVEEPEVKPFESNVVNVPAELKTQQIDESKLEVIKLGEGEKPFVAINSIGDTIPTGVSIPATSKTVPAIHQKPEIAMSLSYHINSKLDVSQLSVREGLINDHIKEVLSDSKGNIWFASHEAGLIKYDGIRFTNFSTEQGLLDYRAQALEEDSQGNIWIGTNGGICVYDGENFTQFTDRDGLVNNDVNSLFIDEKDVVWIGTSRGLSRFDGKDFFNYVYKEGLKSIVINDIEGDLNGNIWLATNNALSKFNGDQFTHYTTNDGLTSDQIKMIQIDQEGKLWIATKFGLNCLFENEIFQITEEDGLPSNDALSLHSDKDNNLWIGFNGNGLCYYNGKNIRNITEDAGLSSGKVWFINEDLKGNIWVAFRDQGGVNRINLNGFSSSNVIGAQEVLYPILEDRKKRLWFGFASSGVAVKEDDKLKVYEKGFGLKNIWALLEDSRGNIWTGSWGEGLAYFDGNKYNRIAFKRNAAHRSSAFLNSIHSMIEDVHGNLWFSTWGAGVIKYDGEQFINYTDANGIGGNKIRYLINDSEGNIWMTFVGAGICKFDGSSFINYTEKEGLDQYPALATPFEDSHGNLWLSGPKGISILNGETIHLINEDNGLCQNSGASIIEDANGNIWVATQGGLSLITKDYCDKYILRQTIDDKDVAPSIINFDYRDGLNIMDFNSNKSVTIDNSNTAWWGAGAGNLYSLDLNKFNITESTPRVFVSGLDINERYFDFHHTQDSTLNGIAYSKVDLSKNVPTDLVLDHNVNHLTFKFTAFDWKAPHKIKYSYRITGIDKSWSEVTEYAFADYRNLPYGEHKLIVRAIGQSGIWSEPYEYSFTINPPWWHTWWARSIYGMLLIIAIIAYDRYRTAAWKARKIELETEVKKATKEISEQKNIAEIEREKAEKARAKAERNEAFKQQFLANMSHEIRTPMNAILGMTNLTLDTELNPKQRDYLDAVKKSTENLLVIINDILDLSKLEAGKMDLEFIPFNLEEQLNVVHDTLRFKAEEKALDFKVNIDKTVPKYIKGDPYRLNQILINLCGNSIKFTEKGHVHVIVNIIGDKIRYSVSDTGIGMSEENTKKLFAAFQQAEESTSRKYGGTGLGLSISKTLVELQNGEIGANSEEGKGSEFYFILPFEKAGEKDIKELAMDKHVDVSNLSGIKILLAEDNKFNQIVLHDTIKHLIDAAHVDIAENGKIAVEKVTANNYDVVLMDINMPEMTGHEATKHIRNKLGEDKKDITILALTASILNDDIKSFEKSGMNDYIPKPFTREELLSTLSKYYSKT